MVGCSLMRRYLNLSFVLLLLTGCHGRPTKPDPGLGDPVLRLSRLSGLGFCPRMDEIFKATVWRNAAGTHTVTGSILVTGDSLRDSCIGLSRLMGRCLVEALFEPCVLTPAQAAELYRLLAAVPVEPHVLNSLCDPCLITRYEFDGRIEVPYPCASSTEGYRKSLADIEHFLKSLVPVASQ